MTPEESFINSFNTLSRNAHANAVQKGFWTNDDRVRDIIRREANDLSGYLEVTTKAAKLALIHSEASEVLEGLRHGNHPDDKVPEFETEAAELADVIIRIMDYAGRYRVRVSEALVAKMAMNKSRPPMHGGKKL